MVIEVASIPNDSTNASSVSGWSSDTIPVSSSNFAQTQGISVQIINDNNI